MPKTIKNKNNDLLSSYKKKKTQKLKKIKKIKIKKIKKNSGRCS